MNDANVTTTATQNDQTESGTLDSITVSYAQLITVTKTSPQQLSWIVEQIRSSADLANRIARIRALTTLDERREAKQRLLPYFCPSVFTNGERTNSSFASTRLIVIDIDHLGDRLSEVYAALQKDSEVLISFVSPGGDGLKVIFHTEKEITDESTYRSVFQKVCETIRVRYKVDPDANDDPARACFLSYDPDLYYNPECKPVAIPTLAPDKTEKKPKHTIREKLAPQAPGDRTPTLVSLVGTWIKKGISQDEALHLARLWNKANTPPLSDAKIESTVHDVYNRYDDVASKLPIRFFERNDRYLKNVKGADVMIATFILEPRELLVLDDNDCLVCDVRSMQGYEYKDVAIESGDWHSKQKLLKAIRHQDCVFVGSDTDLQALCAYVNLKVPVRRTGTRVIGMHNGTWVAEGMNITVSGISNEPTIVPYDKGNGAFYHKIAYADLPDVEYGGMVRDFYTDILRINERKVILPLIGWLFATPVKEIVRSAIGAFPSVLVHGGQGSGKTSTAKLLMRLVGYKNPVPSKCDMRPFPMLKNLSATNGIPQFYDEFKQSDMKEEQVDSLLRYIREIYDGELEQKGREDQTTVDYELLAPMAVLGEWNINQPAIRERALMIRFSDRVKKDKMMRAAFERLRTLPLEAFMPRFILFCLAQDIPAMLMRTRSYVEEHFRSKGVAPRIVNNLAVMLLGLVLFQDYAVSCGLDMPAIWPEDMLDDQLKEITGTEAGQVRSAVDQLIEELGIMWQKNEKQITSTTPGYEPNVKQMPWWTTATVDKRKVVAIRFNKVFPEFKEYAQRTKYEGDLLDKESYMRLFKENDYVVSTSHPVDFEGKKQRCLCVDMRKATEAGLDLEGFGVTAVTE